MAEPKAAPYIDITAPTRSLVDVANATGQKVFTLAFVLADSSGCNPSWGGTIPLDDPRIIEDIQALKAMGGDVVDATGGAAGPYLEYTCGSADALAGAYGKILDATGANHLDVDVEATIPQDMVNQALKRIPDEHGTSVSYTLRVQGDDYGLDPYPRAGAGVRGGARSGRAGEPDDHGVRHQQAGLGRRGDRRRRECARADAVGLAVHAGRGPQAAPRGHADDRAQPQREDLRPVRRTQLVDWANANQIGLVAFWSAGRDNGSCPGDGVSPTCSSIDQSDYEFTTIMRGFHG